MGEFFNMGETNIILLQSLFHYLKSKSKSKINKTGIQSPNGKHNFSKSLFEMEMEIKNV